jgi:hypothetical protein
MGPRGGSPIVREGVDIAIHALPHDRATVTHLATVPMSLVRFSRESLTIQNVEYQLSLTDYWRSNDDFEEYC